jgi:hypothetical protein
MQALKYVINPKLVVLGKISTRHKCNISKIANQRHNKKMHTLFMDPFGIVIIHNCLYFL